MELGSTYSDPSKCFRILRLLDYQVSAFQNGWDGQNNESIF